MFLRFTGWTSREKRLLGVNLVLLLVVGGLVLTFYRGDQSVETGMFQPYPDLSQEGSIQMIEGREGHSAQNIAFTDTEYSSHSALSMEEMVMVDIKGAVRVPGVYPFSPTDRVIDAIEKAGGLLEEASTLPVNLAQPLHDGMVIYIPTQDEVLKGTVPAHVAGLAESSVSGSSKININTATSEQLQALPGIGPARAAAIVRYREEHGPFKAVEELTNVSGIGPKILENIADQIEL